MTAITPGIVRARRLFHHRLLYWFLGPADAVGPREQRPAKKASRPRRREDFIEEAAMMREMHRL